MSILTKKHTMPFFEDKTEKLLTFFIIILSVILFIRDVADIGVSQIIVLGLMAMPIVFLPFSKLLYYTIFVCAIVKGVNAYIMPLLLVALIFKNPRNSVAQFAFVIFLLVIELFDSLHILLMRDYFFYASFLGLFYFILFQDPSSINTNDCLKYFCCGLSITLLIVTVSIFRNPLDMIFREDIRAAMGAESQSDGSHFILNANEYAYYAISLLGILLLGKRRLKLPVWLYAIFLILSLLSGILSQSRTFIILALFILIIYLLQSNLKIKLITIIAAFALGLITVTYYNDFINSAFDGILMRFESSNFETAGNRTILFKEYNDFLVQNPQYILSGTGAIYYKDVARCSNSIHNAIQQIYVCYGVIGCIIFLSTIILFIHKYKRKSTTIIDYIPLLASVAFIQSIQFLNPYHLMLPVAVAACSLKRIKIPDNL